MTEGRLRAITPRGAGHRLRFVVSIAGGGFDLFRLACEHYSGAQGRREMFAGRTGRAPGPG